MKLTLIDDSSETLRYLLTSFGAAEIKVEIQYISYAPSISADIEDRIFNFAPALIVLDLLLTEDVESGFRIPNRLKEFQKLSRIPVIVCSKYIDTGRFGRNIKSKAIALGAADAVPKMPFPPASEFLRHVANTAEERTSAE